MSAVAADAAAARRRRRLAWVLAGVAALAVVAAAVAGVVPSRSLGPLEHGGGLMTHEAFGDVEYREVHAVDMDARDAYAIDGSKPSGFRVTFEIVVRRGVRSAGGR